MRNHAHAATHRNQQAPWQQLVALLLMVVVPTLLIGMTRATTTFAQFLLGLAAGLGLVAGGVYIYHLGKPA